MGQASCIQKQVLDVQIVSCSKKHKEGIQISTPQ